jgi:peptidoglycan/LPS O-acetylase OafA/YrhL
MGRALTYRQYRETRYFRALDGLRAISILLVVFFHASPSHWVWVHGSLGVTIFFVISGFLITTLSLREEDKRGALSVTAFYIRRACRIFPLYYSVLLFYIVLVIGLNYHHHRSLLLSSLPYYLFYLNDLTPHLEKVPFALSWSLGVEEKFYIVWPLLAFVLLRGRTAARFAGVSALILVPFFLDRIGLLPRVSIYGSPLYYSYTAILVGCLLAFLLHHESSYRVFARLGGGIGALCSLLLLVAIHYFEPTDAWTQFSYPFGVALAMIAIVIGDAIWVRALATSPMVFVGIRSYGVYLVHGFCLSVLATVIARSLGSATSTTGALTLFVVGFGVSLAVASVLNVTLERKFIALGRRLTRRLAHEEPVAPARMPVRAPHRILYRALYRSHRA